MPAIDFPASPAVNDEYSFEGRTWRWNGTGWEVKEYPAALLAGTAANPSLYFTGDPNTGLYSPGADQVALSTGGAGRLFVDASGNIGVGVEAPTRQIDIAASNTTAGLGYAIRLRANPTAAASAIQWTTSDAGSTNGYIACDTSRAIYLASGSTERMRITLAGTTTITSNASTAPFIANIGASEVARIDSSGRLLVGTSTARSGVFFNGDANANPSFQIERAGDGAATASCSLALVRNTSTNAGPGVLLARSAGTTNGSVTSVASGDTIGAVSYQAADGTDFVEAARIEAFVDGTPGANDMPGRLVFFTTADGASSPTERMRITNAGKVLVNATSTTYAAPTFGVRGEIEQTIATYNNGDIFFRFLSGTQGSATIRGNIETNGTNVLYNTASDARLKENIQDSPDSGALIDAIHVRAFDWRESGLHQDYGFVAQELAEIYPQAVSCPPDDRLLGVDYGQLAPLLLKEIQSLRSRVAALEAQ